MGADFKMLSQPSFEVDNLYPGCPPTHNNHPVYSLASDTVLGTVETISGTFLLQPSIHNIVYIHNP